MNMRLRFAPSPTGYLHVGGARTAIFNWLFARKEGGVLVLRIEDTDRVRSSEEHTKVILDGLTWLGVDWDEGPFFQSEGVERHRADATRLLEEGKAYRDFTDTAAMRLEAKERGMHPSRVVREKMMDLGAESAKQRAEAGEPFAIRLLVPDGETVFDDLVHGEMRFGNDDIDDLVILRSDGTPTYNLAVVSDDADMRITHVLRGDDHLSNAPKQVLLYRALGYPEPVFAHVPLILGSDGRKLSKRHGAMAVGDYAEEGIVPEAMMNFLALLGWSPGDDRELMTREELLGAFGMERLLKSASVFDIDKLEWLNGRHLDAYSDEELAKCLRDLLQEDDSFCSGFLDDVNWLSELLGLIKPRARRLDQLAEQARPFVCQNLHFDMKAVEKHLNKDPGAAIKRLQSLYETFRGADWTREELEVSLRDLASQMEVGAGKLIHPLRIALTGNMASPGIFDVLYLLGRERSLSRIEDAVERINLR
ncbi:MAG: glutamate--tRNA ligase [Gemmatimonadetes bacterium]|nr:glutamate--tRNA ligase [Gemmatimonadota bacterium]|tara:strand:- start:155 stop:1588 length:1434 start_codon:yes stop_codon:yes gene_type:complete